MTRLPKVLRWVRPYTGPAVVRALTRWIAPITRRVSRLFGSRSLPQRVFRSTKECVDASDQTGVTYHVVQPAEGIASRALPMGIPESDRFLNHGGWEVPQGFVVTIHGGRVVGEDGVVIASGNTLLMDLPPDLSLRTPDEHPIFRRLRLPKMEYCDATIAVLTRPSSDNFAHFLLDTIPRLCLIERAHALADIDYFLVSRRRRFQRELLEMVGISGERVLENSARTHMWARSLIVPSMPFWQSQLPSWALRYLQEKLGSGAATSSNRRRIYVSRGRDSFTRRVVNEDEVVGMLRAHGFESIRLEQLPLRDQISAFKSAEAVVAPHGAGLSHVVFCQPGTKVIEIFAPNFVNPVFWNLSCQVKGVDYCYLIGERNWRVGENQRDRRPVAEDLYEDITVDIRNLEQALSGSSL
jgi:capsular polysaccharide biosynthesis protein